MAILESSKDILNTVGKVALYAFFDTSYDYGYIYFDDDIEIGTHVKAPKNGGFVFTLPNWFNGKESSSVWKVFPETEDAKIAFLVWKIKKSFNYFLQQMNNHNISSEEKQISLFDIYREIMAVQKILSEILQNG